MNGSNTGKQDFLRARISGAQHFIGVMTREKSNLLKKLSRERR
jgi:hypothetical protein